MESKFMATSKEVANDIISKMEELATELTTWNEKGRKASAKRSRKATIELQKLFKDFRHMSVEETKSSAPEEGGE